MVEFTLHIGNKSLSSWSLRPWLALKQAQIPFEERRVRLRTPESAALLAAISPSGKVPVLHHRDRVVWESLAILEYMAELFPEAGLWPVDPGARALARSVAAEMHSGFREMRRQWPMNLRRARKYKALLGEGETDRQRILTIWRQCREEHRAQGPFLFGSFTAADAMYAPVVTRFHTWGGELDADTADYVEAVLSLPAMRQWYAEAAEEPWPEPDPDEE